MKCILVSMPWASAGRPNLSVGVLVASARQHGFDCRAFDASLSLAATIGHELYQTFAQENRFFGVCEHLFASQVFGCEALRSDDFLRTLLATLPNRAEAAFFGDLLTLLRDRTLPAFVAAARDHVLARSPDVVGFSCTFNQVFASLALAQAIKAVRPDICIAMGGSCLHGEMGVAYARRFPALIDHVFVGEADDTFPAFLRHATDGSARGLPGITVAGELHADALPASMEAVPAPDYDDFFELRQRLLLEGASLPAIEGLPFESSRGCWWGEKNHCTFCGLNTQGMAHRAKPAAQALEDMRGLAERYGILDLLAADNILDMRYFETLLPLLATEQWDLRIFYEVKANLKRPHFEILRAAGVRSVQPGIESFSTPILRHMRKGVSALQNVRFLRLCREYGILPSYNVLTGFRGETDTDYIRMTALVTRLYHLPPPSGRPSAAQIHRFSPFHRAPDEFGFARTRPAHYYEHLFPQEDAGGLSRFAYFFDADRTWELDSEVLTQFNAAIDAWIAADTDWVLRIGPGGIHSVRRTGGQRSDTRLSPMESVALVCADGPSPLSALQAKLAGACAGATVEAIDDCIAALIRSGLLACEQEQVVNVVPFESARTDGELARAASQWAQRAPAKAVSRAASVAFG